MLLFLVNSAGSTSSRDTQRGRCSQIVRAVRRVIWIPADPANVARHIPPWGEWSDAQDLGPRGRTRVPVSEATDKPATPWSVAAILPGSGVAQLGTTPSGQTLSGDEEQGSELLTFSLRASANWCVLGPTEGATTHHLKLLLPARAAPCSRSPQLYEAFSCVRGDHHHRSCAGPDPR